MGWRPSAVLLVDVLESDACETNAEGMAFGLNGITAIGKDVAAMKAAAMAKRRRVGEDIVCVSKSGLQILMDDLICGCNGRWVG